MTARILVDTGPLVAIISEKDQHHRTCAKQFAELEAPLFSCWPVLTEAAWLLRHSPPALKALFHSVGPSGFVKLLDLEPEAVPWISSFLDNYRRPDPDKSPQLADAALVYLAERERIETIFTVDHTDFSLFRLGGKRPLRLLPPLPL